MKILDIQKPNEDTGIFSSCFRAAFPVEYAKIFGETEPNQLDTYTGIKYGLREVIPVLTVDTWKDGVNAIITVNVRNWVKQAELLNLTYDILNPVIETTHTDTETTNTDTDNSTNESLTKTFNNNEYTGRDKQTDTREQTRRETHRVNSTKSGVGSNTSYTTTIREEYRFRKEHWQRGIIEQLVNEITISIYN